MARTKPMLVVNVALTASEQDFDTVVRFLDRDFRIIRIGTDGKVEKAERLVREWATEADAIAVTGVRDARVRGLYDGDLDAVERIMRAADRHPRDQRPRPARRPAGVDGPRTSRPTMPGLLQQRADRGVRRHEPLPHGADPQGVHRQPHVRRPVLRIGLPSLLDSLSRRSTGSPASPWLPLNLVPGQISAPITAAGARLNQSLLRKAVRDATSWWPPTTSCSTSVWRSWPARPLITSAISDERLEDLQRARRRHRPRRRAAAVRR